MRVEAAEVSMISIRKYLDGGNAEEREERAARPRRELGKPLVVALGVYRSAVTAISRGSLDACPATGQELEKCLSEALRGVEEKSPVEVVAEAGEKVDRELLEWGRKTARHFQQKASEVKDILLAMAQTAASVGERDQRCAEQISGVTAKLRSIASLDDISEMRRSIETSAAELKTSIERMTSEGRAVLDALEAKVSTFKAKLEEAEEVASCDTLTKLRSRLCMENQLEQRVESGAPFCVAILDIDGFKGVNDVHGHVVGDEVLKQFSVELKLACRSSDVVGRWGGDEFIVVLDCALTQAQAQIERVKAWVCGNYTVDGATGPVKLRVDSSIGLAEFAPPETLKELLDRADTAMYQHKAASRAGGSGAVHGKARTA
jgi:diguanylate cyclase (GGDEF)-like protein